MTRSKSRLSQELIVNHVATRPPDREQLPRGRKYDDGRWSCFLTRSFSVFIVDCQFELILRCAITISGNLPCSSQGQWAICSVVDDRGKYIAKVKFCC